MFRDWEQMIEKEWYEDFAYRHPKQDDTLRAIVALGAGQFGHGILWNDRDVVNEILRVGYNLQLISRREVEEMWVFLTGFIPDRR